MATGLCGGHTLGVLCKEVHLIVCGILTVLLLAFKETGLAFSQM